MSGAFSFRVGTKVRDTRTGEVGTVVSVVRWDRTYTRVRWADGVESVHEGRELIRADWPKQDWEGGTA